MSELYFIEYLNKDKNFNTDKVGFRLYDDAIKWGKSNLTNFDLDMINLHSSDEFLFNESKVCLNPIVLYSSESLVSKFNLLAWDYLSIEIAQSDGFWYWGSSHFCGGSPCSLSGLKFDSKESVKNAAITWVKDYLKNGNSFTQSRSLDKHINHFDAFLLSETQPTLF